MAKGIFGSFSDIASATNTDPVDVSHLETIYAAGTGTFVGTWALQFTMDDLGNRMRSAASPRALVCPNLDISSVGGHL